MDTKQNTRCEVCDSGPVAYRRSRGGNEERVCVLCARQRGAEMNGEAYVALETLGFAVSRARIAGVTDEQIRLALDSILTRPHSEGFFPVGGESVLRIDDLGWERGYEAVS